MLKFERGERIPNTRLCYLEDRPTIKKRRKALFLCDCGKEIERDLHWVKHLNIMSCGCLKSELVTAKNTKHSHAVANSGAYRSWQAMHQRVKANPLYKNRPVCDRWCGEDGFVNFYVDMGDRPEGLTLDRIDNDQGYSPENCRWADRYIQSQNTSNTVNVTIGEETHSINEWCRIKNIKYRAVKQRWQNGMSLIEALTAPINESKRRLTLK